MAVRFLIAVLVMLSASLIAQDAYSQPDSLDVTSRLNSPYERVLRAPTAADSLEAARLLAEAAAQKEKADVDTLNLTHGMRDAIDTSLSLQNLMPFPFLMHRENNHYFAPFAHDQLLRWNGFTLHPARITQTRQYQSYAPLFNTRSSFAGHRFDNANYNLPAAFTEAWLGLGDFDMTHAVVRFHKALLLGVPKLSVEASYSGMAGQWYDHPDETADFNGHLRYESPWGDVHLYHTAINEESADYILHPTNNTAGTVTHHDIQTAVLWDAPFFDFGYRFQTTDLRYDTIDEDHELHSILLRGHTRIVYNDFEISVEPTWMDDDFMQVGTIDHSFTNTRISTANTIHFSDDNWDFYSEGQVLVFSWLAAVWQARLRNDSFVQDDTWLNAISSNDRLSCAAGLTLLPHSLNLNVSGGKTETDYRRDFLQISSQGSLPWRRYSLDVNMWSRYLPDPGSWLPAWQLNADVALCMHLEHDNAVSLGADWLYASDYYFKKMESGVENAYATYAQNLDLYVKIQVSKLFDIEGRAVNVLNNTTLFNMVGTLPQTHYNVSLRWFFKN